MANIAIVDMVTVNSTVDYETHISSQLILEIVSAVTPVAIVSGDNDRIERARSLAIFSLPGILPLKKATTRK